LKPSRAASPRIEPLHVEIFSDRDDRFSQRTLNVSATLFSNSSMKMKLLLTALTSLIGTAVFAADAPPVGSAAPDFSLTDAKGKTHSLSEYKGKYVVLEWFNPECPFVKKHYGSSNMQNLQKEFTDKGVVWLTIDSNAPGTQGSLTAEEAQKIASSWKTHETALLLDPEGNAGRAYGAKNTPNMVIINPEGKVIYRGAIDSKATPNPSDIPSSTNYVKAALDQSLSGKSVATPETKPYGCSVKYKSS
jgi:peroxiredoxin